MKKLILVMAVILTATLAMASGWDNTNGTSTDPNDFGYWSTFYAGSIYPLTANTGQLGSSGNAFNSSWQDTAQSSLTNTIKLGIVTSFGAASAFTIDQYGYDYNIAAENHSFKQQNGRFSFSGKNSMDNLIVLACSSNVDSTTKGWKIRGRSITQIALGSSVSADTGKFMTIKTAKDTCLEVALFTRTCTRDTLAFMTGADSLTAAYIVSPFATRGAMTRPPYVAGVVGGKLVIDRAAADTAFFDRYSVTKIMQR